MNYRAYTQVILLLFLAVSCSKRSPVGETTTQMNIERQIFNSMEQPVNLKIYASTEDYNNETNPIFEIKIDGHDTITWTSNQALKICYVDWWTEGNALNNWGAIPAVNRIHSGPGPALELFSFQLLGGSLIEYSQAVIEDETWSSQSERSIYNNQNLRETFISPPGKGSKWQAVDIRNNSTHLSYWDDLHPVDKYHEFIFNRDMSAQHSFMHTLYDTITINFTFKPDYEDSLFINCAVPFNSGTNNVTLTNKYPSGLYTTTTDSLYLLLPDKYYILKKIH